MNILLFLVAVLIVLAGGIWSGVYNISALSPHWEATLEVIEIARDRSIIAHSGNVRLPHLDDPKLAAKGAADFQEMCRPCHGAPGMPAEVFAQGLYPAPANLLSGDVQKEWQDNQLFWIIDNGLKMTGMPAFGPTNSKDTLFGIVAFLKQLPGMTPEQYKAIVATSGESPPGQSTAGDQRGRVNRNVKGR